MIDDTVHFEWHPDAIKNGKAPDCGAGNYTPTLSEVTCKACSERIRQIIQEWVDGLGEGDGQAT